MRKVYTGIDIGSDSIKIVVSEYFNNKFHVLASTTVPSVGVKRGLIIESDKVAECIKKGTKEIESTIGLKIESAIVTVASNDRKLSVVSGNTALDGAVTGNDIVDALTDASVDNVEPGYELITTIPILFDVDDNKNIADPKGRMGSILSVKAVMITVPRENLIKVLEVFKICNIEVKDVIFKTIGDYYEAKGKDLDKELGAVINVGSETIDVSIFNKGIIIKNDIINLGSKNIDKDISYVYGVDLETSRDLKENFSVCSRKYADVNDIVDIKISDEETISINQYELSEVVEARVSELLKLAKKSINNLTNRKISYIIITGGITNIAGFAYLLDNELDYEKIICNMTTLGIRSNTYSTSFGLIKYFDEKMKFRDIDWNMFSEDEKIELTAKKNKVSNQENLIQKFEAYLKK